MASESMQRFFSNCGDIDRLMEFHEAQAGDGKGRRWNVDVLNRAGLMLISAYWEAYVEDVCLEATNLLCSELPSADTLPVSVQASLVAENAATKAAPNRPWNLAGENWRQALKSFAEKRIDGLQDGGMNTPRPFAVKSLFSDVLGIQDLTACWFWQNRTVEQSCQDLNDYITKRGTIVHRGQDQNTVRKTDCTGFLSTAKLLVEKTDGAIESHLNALCGRGF